MNLARRILVILLLISGIDGVGPPTRSARTAQHAGSSASLSDVALSSDRGTVTMRSPADTLYVDSRPIARYSNAVSVSMGADGRIYVVDAGANRIAAMGPDRESEIYYGRSGTEEGEFDEPADLDVGNGLVISVADAGNARIQRFSRDFRFLERIPVGGGSSSTSLNPSFRPGADALETPGNGFPVAVTSSREDDLFIIDSSSSRVYRWDRDRRNRWTIGGAENVGGSLQDPVDLDVDGDLLYVADRARASILVFDLFGSFIREIGSGRLPEIQAVKIRFGRIWVIQPDRLIEYDISGRLVRQIIIVGVDDIADIEPVPDGFLVLTGTRLARVTISG